jgi:hypothetical protein
MIGSPVENDATECRKLPGLRTGDLDAARNAERPGPRREAGPFARRHAEAEISSTVQPVSITTDKSAARATAIPKEAGRHTQSRHREDE